MASAQKAMAAKGMGMSKLIFIIVVVTCAKIRRYVKLTMALLEYAPSLKIVWRLAE